nr:uncharacterized protein LOC129414162 [Misgurnus anguillicaudatus]
MIQHHLSQRHFKGAIFYKEANSVKFTIPCYCTDGAHGRSHWHCSKCAKTIQRAVDFKTHLKKHGCEMAEKSSVDPQTTRAIKDSISEEKLSLEEQAQKQLQHQTPVKRNLPPEKAHLKCQTCRIEFSTTSNLRRHEKMQHGLEEPMLCVDQKNAIYVTPKEQHGPRLPVHIIKSPHLDRLFCESETCRDMSSIATRSGYPATECRHLKRSCTAEGYIPPPPLNSISLDKMLDKGLISKSRLQECRDLHLKSSEEGVDCVFPVFWGEHGLSQRYIYFSVFTNLKDSWCLLGRTIVTFDTISGKWHCQCRGTKHRQSCVHRYLCMWWIFQERPEFLQKDVNVTPEEIEDLNEQEEMDDEPQQPNETESGVIQMTEYFLKIKRIPEDLPQDLIITEMPVPESFVPEETQCPYCPGPCPPNLGEAQLKTKHATIYGLFSVHKGIHVYIKKCPVCGNTVRFQEYKSGFHNFNDKVFVTIPLCSLLTTGFSNHIAVGRLLRTLEDHSKVYIPHNTLRKAFYHFSALRSYSYNFFCYRCGHHAPILIADTNWKVAFDLPVHLMKRPDLTNSTSQDTQVNVTERWENLEKEIIATGFCDDTCSNPFSSSLSYSAFTPWIGQYSRMSNVIPKTEIYKGLSQKDRLCPKRANEEVDEDKIRQILDTKVVIQHAHYILKCIYGVYVLVSTKNFGDNVVLV